MHKELSKQYDFSEVQSRIYRLWIESGAITAIPDKRENRYVIMMPLPNITGALHMGHAMDNVMQDLLIRWHRMKGDNTLWMPGADHAGIATQAVVEKRLFELESKTRHDIGREELVSRIWTWKDEYLARIIDQQKGMGCSCDWGLHRFTMDDVCTRAVREAFFRLFKDGLIFRGNRLVNWDCHLQTAISDDEIVHETVKGHFWHIRYPVVDPREGEPKFVVVATTRPETMLGDTAVAVHPDPEGTLRQSIKEIKKLLEKASSKERPELEQELEGLKKRKISHLPGLLKLVEMAKNGKEVILPLLNRRIPIILDEWAKPDLGTGCVKITPAHDNNDYEVWLRHRQEIAIVNLLNPDGTYNENAGPYAGMDRFKVREKVVADLEEQDLMSEVEDRDIEIGHSDRSKTQIESYLSKQWFIRMGDVGDGLIFGAGTRKQFRGPGLAQAAIDAVDHNWFSPSHRNLTFHPDPIRYASTYKNWLTEKRDWCISRQLWWGHQIPIWHGSVSKNQLTQIQDFVSESPKDRIWAWATDEEGNLTAFPVDPVAEPVMLLVCIRYTDDEEELGTTLEKLGLKRDPDVLDTWFSSSLWPFSTLGWPDPEKAKVGENRRSLGKQGGRPDYLEYYYPGSCLVTDRGIITLWVARMLIMGLYLLGDVPFTDCFIHATIQDGKGERMSKSKGNGIDPNDIVQEYGADAMRYVLCDMQTGTQDIRLPVQAISPYTGERVDLATASHGRTVFTYICPKTGKEFDVLGTIKDLPKAKVTSDRFDTGRSFCTKLWNAARFTLMNLGKYDYRPVKREQLEAEDLWILSRLSKTIAAVTRHLEQYNPSAAIGTARDFFWSELCDWYLELIKPRLKDDKYACTARTVLSFAFDMVLRLFHPFVPFITEALWEKLNEQAPVRGLESELPGSRVLVAAQWPVGPKQYEDKARERDFTLIQQVIRLIRNLKARHNVSPTREVDVLIKARGAVGRCIVDLGHLIRNMAFVGRLEVGEDIKRPASSAVQVEGETEVYVVGLLDPEKEKAKLENQKTLLQRNLVIVEKKLSNPNFLKKAPPQVVEQERKKLGELKSQIQLIDNNLKTFL